MLFRERELVYVGQSRNCGARIKQHLDSGREFDYAAITPLNAVARAWIEPALIKAAQPPGNRVHTDNHLMSRVVDSNMAEADRLSSGRSEPEAVAPAADDTLTFISKTEAAKRAGRYRIHAEFLVAYKRGDLNFIHHGRSIIIRATEFRAWCEEQAQKRAA